jgi:outer membrane protein OmpA-like peptidoglycan-associated protein
MSRKIFVTLLLCFWGCYAWGQADTLYWAEGKIISGSTKEAVNARITYQSLPYGNIVGELNGSTYRFALYGKEKYEITVEANGFSAARYMIDPAEANSERKVIKDIELTLPSPAAQVSESTHSVGKVMRLDNLLFQQGKYKIDPSSYSELDGIANMLHNYPKMVIQLEGHTDFRGDPKENMKLSQQRVDAVKDYLVNKGVGKHKVKTKAFGGTNPISQANTEESRRLNRRVEVRIVEN